MARTLSLKTLLRSRDLEASRRWYAEILRLEVTEEWDEGDDRGFVVSFGPRGGLLEVLAAGRADPSPGRPEAGATRALDRFELQVRVDSVDAWARRLAGRVRVEGPVTRPWGNRYLWIRDPDGIRIALYETPAE